MRNVKVYVISETTKPVAGNFVEFYESPNYAVSRAEELARNNRLGEDKLRELVKSLEYLERRRAAFLSLPWFVRVWRALRREL